MKFKNINGHWQCRSVSEYGRGRVYLGKTSGFPDPMSELRQIFRNEKFIQISITNRNLHKMADSAIR